MCSRSQGIPNVRLLAEEFVSVSVVSLEIRKSNLLNQRILNSLIAAIYGVWFIGWNQLLPWNTKWLLPSASRIDHAVSYLNWEFLRHSPLFQFPFGKLVNSGVGWNSVYVPFASGSLFGIFFRPIEFLLPEPFQFMGFWIVFSFSMLGYWSTRLVAIFVASRWVVAIGAVFLTTAPIISYRLGILGHFELSAHWLLFAALALYFERVNSVGKWAFLCVVALVVNIYLFVMVFGVMIAASIRGLMLDKCPVKYAKVIIGTTFASVIAFSFFGFLAFSKNAVGLGFFRLNAGSFFFPNYSLGVAYSGTYSWLLDRTGFFANRQFIAFEREGFGFLGLGAILGLIISLAVSVKHFRLFKRSHALQLLPLGVVVSAFFLNSMSQKIAFGRREILHVPIPDVVEQLRQVFRTAERFSWLLYYIVFLYVIWAIHRMVRPKLLSVSLLLLLLVVQLVDSWPGIRESRNILLADPVVMQIDDLRWSEVIEGKTSILLVPTFDFIADDQSEAIDAWRTNSSFFPIIQLAAKHGLSTNFAVTGRPVGSLIELTNDEIESSITTGRVDSRGIYVFARSEDWNSARRTAGERVQFAMLDGYYVMYTSDPMP